MYCVLLLHSSTWMSYLLAKLQEKYLFSWFVLWLKCLFVFMSNLFLHKNIYINAIMLCNNANRLTLCQNFQINLNTSIYCLKRSLQFYVNIHKISTVSQHMTWQQVQWRSNYKPTPWRGKGFNTRKICTFYTFAFLYFLVPWGCTRSLLWL